MSANGEQKVLLFLPINAAGHLNSSVAIADRLRADHNFRSIFLIVGPPPSSEIVQHGHELRQLEEMDPLVDYEIEPDEDTSKPVDEEKKRCEGKSPKVFPGSQRWAQVLARHQHKMMSTPFEAFKSTSHLIGNYLVGNLIANRENVEREIERIKPDLIICDAYLPMPKVLKEEQQRPWVRLHTGNPLPLTRPKPDQVEIGPTSRLYSKEERERLRREEPEKWQAIVDEWRQMGAEIKVMFAQSFTAMRDFYRANNCDRLESGKSTVDSPLLNTYMFPQAIDYDQDDDLLEYPARWLRCDSLIRAPSGDGELKYWASLMDERLQRRPGMKVIFFSLGSLASGNLRLMKKYMEILSNDPNEDRLYVVSKGVNGDKFELDERNMIGANYLPQPFFLQRADLAIIHGGNNSITECLYYGQPTIVLPNFYDQFDNAQRIEDLKLGRAFGIFDCTKEQLLGAIDDLLRDDSLRQRLQQISQAMQARDELGKLSEIISNLVERQHLSPELARKYNIRLEC